MTGFGKYYTDDRIELDDQRYHEAIEAPPLEARGPAWEDRCPGSDQLPGRRFHTELGPDDHRAGARYIVCFTCGGDITLADDIFADATRRTVPHTAASEPGARCYLYFR